VTEGVGEAETRVGDTVAVFVVDMVG
jgi:hypothetical protein